ncbi:MAG: hypothetical protein PUC37_01005 [Spirochaetales bacterium]|nr:hypothetical protein [Spirochaetales bacterium]
MKEDILEQVVEDWYVSQPGWFVKHNIKYKPDDQRTDYVSSLDSVHSDIDILTYSSIKHTPDNVHVISCKSWQGGLSLKYLYDIIEEGCNHKDWKYFRELVSDKWIEAFIKKIEEETGQRNFTYKIAVTKLNKSKIDYRPKIINNTKLIQRFKKYNSDIKIDFIELKDIVSETVKRLKLKDTPSVEMTDVGRLLQLINAAEMNIS